MLMSGKLCMTVVSTAAFAMASAVPAVGNAVVRASSSHGNGTATSVHWYSQAVKLTGWMRSSNGSPIYMACRSAISGQQDENEGRYTGDTTNTSGNGVSANGTCTSSLLGGSTYQGVHVRHCYNLNNLPDPCGSDSPLLKKNT